MRFVDLKPSGQQGHLVRTVTPQGEYVIQLVSQEGARRGRYLPTFKEGQKENEGSAEEVRCPGLSREFDYAADVLTMGVPRNCLGSPAWVKVQMHNQLRRKSAGFGSTLVNDMNFRVFYDNPHNHLPQPEGVTKRLYRQ